MKIAPDYGTSSEGKEISVGADILIPTHKNAEVDVVKRICQRYDAVIEGLKKTEYPAALLWGGSLKNNICKID